MRFAAPALVVLALLVPASAQASMSLRVSSPTPAANQKMLIYVSESDYFKLRHIFVVRDSSCAGSLAAEEKRAGDHHSGGEPDGYRYADLRSQEDPVDATTIPYDFYPGYFDHSYTVCAYETDNSYDPTATPLAASVSFTPRLALTRASLGGTVYHRDKRGDVRIGLVGACGKRDRYEARRWWLGKFFAVGPWRQPGALVRPDGTISFHGNVLLDETTNYDAPIPAFFPGKPKFGRLDLDGKVDNVPFGSISFNWRLNAGGYHCSGGKPPRKGTLARASESRVWSWNGDLGSVTFTHNPGGPITGLAVAGYAPCTDGTGGGQRVVSGANYIAVAADGSFAFSGPAQVEGQDPTNPGDPHFEISGHVGDTVTGTFRFSGTGNDGDVWCTFDSGQVAFDATPENAPADDGNRPPVAVGDLLGLKKGSRSGRVSVLANDSDPDGDPIHVTSWAQGKHGRAKCSRSECVYTAGKGFAGHDSFQYRITDGHGHSAAARVKIRVGGSAQHERVRLGGAHYYAYKCLWNDKRQNEERCWVMLDAKRTTKLASEASQINSPKPEDAAKYCTEYHFWPNAKACAENLAKTLVSQMWEQSIIDRTSAKGGCLTWELVWHRTVSHPVAGEWTRPQLQAIDRWWESETPKGKNAQWHEGLRAKTWDVPLQCGSDGSVYRLSGGVTRLD